MTFVISKFLKFLLTTFSALILVFLALRLAPGDPVEKILGPEAELREVQALRVDLGLDKSLNEQFIDYMKLLSQGSLGKSLFKKKDVLQMIALHLKPSVIIGCFAIIISGLVGIFLGAWAALNQENLKDKLQRVFSLLWLSFPIFSLAPILVLIFSIILGWFPVSEWGDTKHIFLPVLTLVLPLSSVISRVTRNRFLEEKSSPWVLVLKAKGLHPLRRHIHVLRSIMPTIMNVIAIQMSVLLAGTMVTESIFDIPGLGQLLFEAIQNRDYPLVQGVIVYVGMLYLLVYFFIDIINSKIDPRIRDVNN